MVLDPKSAHYENIGDVILHMLDSQKFYIDPAFARTGLPDFYLNIFRSSCKEGKLTFYRDQKEWINVYSDRQILGGRVYNTARILGTMVLGKRRRSCGGPLRKRLKARATKRFSRKKGMANLIERVMLKQCETKHNSHSQENQQLGHNTPFDKILWSPLSQIAKGDIENQRTGDEIIVKYMKSKFWISAKSDRPNVMFRLVGYRCPKDEIFTNGPDIYEGDHGNKMLDKVNTDKYTPVIQKMFQTKNDSSQEAEAALKETSKSVSFTIQLKDVKIRYEPSGKQPKFQRDCYRMSLTAYDAYGTLTSDTIASFAHCTTVYYKDPSAACLGSVSRARRARRRHV